MAEGGGLKKNKNKRAAVGEEGKKSG